MEARSVRMKLLRPFTGTGSIFWPIGPPPRGTCEFASVSCRKFCYAGLPEWPDWDEEIRVPEVEKRDIYKTMMATPIRLLKEFILSDLDGLQTDILAWFASGDCPTKDIPRVIEIIEALDGTCTQMGFTRNETLWRARKDIFALSIETPSQIAGREGLFSVSDYAKGTSFMYRDGEPTRGGRCGPDLCSDKSDMSLSHFINCKTCRRLHAGCFDR